jgi:hypothetical protein
MDRALDPELLGLALGQHESLPTPQRLSELLAEAELALLLRKPELSDELVATGWYLHAVASSKYALRTYGVERQRAAFRVAGHVFDLLLQQPQLERDDRLKYCFAAQIAYLRSELDPNALAMYHREFASDLAELGLLTHFMEVALSCGIALLGLDVNYVYRVTGNIRDEIGRLTAEWDVKDIFSTPFGSAAGVALGTRDLMSFLVYGRTETLERAQELLRTAVLAESSWEDQISRWVAAHLLNLASDLKRASIWTCLPPDVPRNVRQAFTMGYPKILTLWPPQLKLFGATGQEETNPLSPQVRRLFLSTPTSGGKTLLAQLLVISHLATEGTAVCYVAPTRSLCREVRKSLESRLRFLGTEIIDGLDWLDDIVDFEPTVEVMTPERLSYLLRSDGGKVIERFGLFIFDEVHTIGEADRGWTLEEDLTYLHHMTQGKANRIALISAAVGNRNHFVEWMGTDNNRVVLLESDWRGPRRLHAMWTTERDRDNRIEEATLSKKYPRRVRYPLYGRLDTLISHTGEIRTLRTTEPIGELVLKFDAEDQWKKDKDKSTAFYQMLIPIIEHLSESGPVLVIESTRPSTVRLAQAIAEHQAAIDQSRIQPLIDLVEARLGTKHPLWQILQKGVAYHHGSLPIEIRSAIEEAVSQGQLKFLVATTTMTEGINLPVRSVVVASQGSYGAGGYEEYITGPKLINAIGRAGRAAKETEGVVVLARPAAPDPADFKRLTPSDTDLQVISMLATAKALQTLAAFEELQRNSEDAVFQAATGIVSDFLSFVWFVAAELERLGKLPTIEGIGEVLGHTLAWIQLSPDDQGRWLSVAVAGLASYHKETLPVRKRWAAAGTSISSASVIEQIAQELADTLKNTKIPNDPVEVVRLILDGGRLQRILALPEAPKRKAHTQRAGVNRVEIPVPMDGLLEQWLQGAELLALAEKYFKDVKDLDFRFEQLGDFINNYFEIFFPWILGTIIAWTNNLLQESGVLILFPRAVPAYVRWGINDAAAFELVVRGIQSRTLALRIAKEWRTAGGTGDIRSWVRSMSLADWQQKFGASIAELRSLLEYARDQRGGTTVDLITKGETKLGVESTVTDFPQADVSLAPVDESELSSVGVWAEASLVGRVASRDQSDIQGLLSSGIVFSAKFSASAGKGVLELRLVDPGV